MPADSPLARPEEPRGTPLAKAWKRFKRYAWRATGLYAWFRVGCALFTDNHIPRSLGTKLANFLLKSLSAVGFEPSGALHLPFVLKVWWTSLIVQFEISESVGLAIYLLSFPALLLLYLPFRREFNKILTETEASQGTGRGLAPRKKAFPLSAICSCLLFGWYLLYGGSDKRLPLLLAVFLAGVLFILVAYKAFLRAKPLGSSDLSGLSSVEEYASKGLKAILAQVKDNTQKPASLAISLKMFRWQRWILIHLAAFLRGKRGKDRIYLLLVLQYALSLLLLGACAVLFWALTLRSIDPANLSNFMSLILVLHHFLPGIASPSVKTLLPLWAELGPGITAWVLLGAYVAASGSLLPGKQLAYAERAEKTFAKVRLATVTFNQLLQVMSKKQALGLTDITGRAMPTPVSATPLLTLSEAERVDDKHLPK